MIRHSIFSALLALMLLSDAANANPKDDFESFLRQQEQGVAGMQSDFRAYKDSQDEAFANFLKGQWRDLDARQGRPRMSAPEPTVAPRFGPQVLNPPDLPVVRTEKPVQPTVIAPQVTAPVRADNLGVAFYGNDLQIPFAAQWRAYRLPAGERPQAISAFWTLMGTSAYEPTFAAMGKARLMLALDDWAYLNLWRDYVQALQPARASEQNLMLWFFLVKSGFDVRMAYAGDDIYLLVAVQQQVYESPQIILDGKTYYPLLADNFGVGMRSFYTYEASYPGALRKVNLGSIRIGFAKVLRASRTLSFKFNDRPVTLTAPYNAAVIPYFNRVPPMDFSVYFNSDASDPLRAEWLPELKRQTAKMSETDAVQFLLTMVQFSFDYKTTLQQFGRDKAFFVDDALYFPYSDCKARAVLFAWLVRNVLGLQVVGLHYPNHLTTAVELKGSHADWVTVEHRGRRYVVDPEISAKPA